MKIEKCEDVCTLQIFENLFRQIAPSLKNFLTYKFKNSRRAEDIVQEAFIALWENCQSITPDQAQAYVFRVGQNLMINKLERDKIHHKYLDLQSKTEKEAGPDFFAEYNELSERLKLAIAQLPDGQREVFMLHRFDDMKYSQIAEMLGISVKAVEKRMHKALVKLRMVIKEI